MDTLGNVLGSFTLTRADLAALAKPFPASKISFKVQTKPSEKGNSLIVGYIDARDVMERLDEVMGPDWSDRYEKADNTKGLACYLTLGGITRADVGDDDNENEPTKSAFSDAFKRAAVKFGVGRFLYDLPKMWAKVKPAGKTFILEDGELEKLQRVVDAAIKGKAPSSAHTPEKAKPLEEAAATSTVEERPDESIKDRVSKPPSNPRKAHGEIWMRCTKAGLVTTRSAVKAWSVTPATPDEEILRKISEMEAALRCERVQDCN